MSYNGWTNYETWNVALWVDNEESIYRDKLSHFRFRDVKAESVRDFCENWFPKGTPDMDSPDDLNKVNWSEITEHWADEINKEYSD